MKKTRLIVSILPGFMILSIAQSAEQIRIDAKNFKQYLQQKKNSIQAKNTPSQFILDKKIVLSNGVTKLKYVQYYHGVPVYGSILSSTETNGSQEQWWGSLLSGITQDIKSYQPKTSTHDALQKAKQIMNLSDPTATELDQVTLYIKQNKTTKLAELVYLVSFNINGPKPKRPHLLLNANTGELIHQWDGLTTRSAAGPGGNEKTGQYIYGADYGSLIVSDACEMKNSYVVTYNMNGRESGGSVFKFVCPNNTYKTINGAYSPLNDAHFFGSIVYDMYKNWYNMDPLNMPLKMRVHFGQDYENAYWDGQQMTFGDGGKYLYPLTVLDVTGHEISHGVTEKNSNLAYEYQSGGINESFSDMAGETAEYFMKSQVGKTNDWLVGDDVIKGPVGSALRYFKDPTLDGQSIGHARNYTDLMDVHYTSGVFNKAFYTLATKPNWGIKKAFEIFLTANRVYWTSDATFDNAACGVSKAANDLTYAVADVAASFKEVGVNANCSNPTPDPKPEPSPNDQEVELKNGEIISHISIGKGKELRYFIKLPKLNRSPYAYKHLDITLYDPKGNAKDSAELFIRYDETLSNAWSKVGFKDEYFSIDSAWPGTYHILLEGKKKASLNLHAYYSKY
jgi:pseudolysin/vibriolysin